MMKKALFFFIFALLFVPALQAQEVATVLRIIDGDTLKIYYLGKEESVRLIGIDTPESKTNQKVKKDALRSESDIATIIAQGKEATVFMKSLVSPGDSVKIEFDVQKWDRYGRLLGYVHHKGKMLNEEIAKAGYASVMTIPPNVKYSERFLWAYQKAKKDKRGLWR